MPIAAALDSMIVRVVSLACLVISLESLTVATILSRRERFSIAALSKITAAATDLIDPGNERVAGIPEIAFPVKWADWHDRLSKRNTERAWIDPRPPILR